MTRIKICGLRSVDHALSAVEAGADLLGFIFAPSKRQITPEAARDIISEVRANRIIGRHGTVRTVGVFVNAAPEEMNRIASLCNLDLLQLSGEESEAVITALERPVINVFHLGDPESARTGSSGNRVRERAATTAAELVLFDTALPGGYGGSGVTFDWRSIPSLDRPFLLAGGLHAGNVGAAVESVRPWGVDVSSGVERDGQKDPQQMDAFISAVRSASGHSSANQEGSTQLPARSSP